MIARVGASLLLLAAVSIGCGKYGPPVRVQREAERPEAVAPADGGDSAEEDGDGDRKEKQP
jgi:hypothetical protein